MAGYFAAMFYNVKSRNLVFAVAFSRIGDLLNKSVHVLQRPSLSSQFSFLVQLVVSFILASLSIYRFILWKPMVLVVVVLFLSMCFNALPHFVILNLLVD